MRKAFTMMELIFVIVIIGILAAIAVPRMAATRDDAVISKARATVGALRSAISMERQKRILKGDFTNIDGAAAEALLDYGLDSTTWARSGNNFTFTQPNSSNSCVFSVSSNKLIKGDCSVSGLSDL